jgi:hypothetical protein
VQIRHVMALVIRDRKVVIFGSGGLAEIVRGWLRDQDIAYLVDNDARKWGETRFGREIRPPEALREEPAGETIVLVASSAAQAITAQLAALGLNPDRDVLDCNYLWFNGAGQFYSPLPSAEEVSAERARLFDRSATHVPGVSLNDDEQLAHLRAFARLREAFPYAPSRLHTLPFPPRYRSDNGFFGYADGFALFAMMQTYQPRRVIEVGSGFSSAVMLDTRELSPDRTVDLTFIDPYPSRLLGLLRDGDREETTILASPVQQVPLATFEALERDDILFIDSSHVVRIGSDVQWLFSEILPRLKAGVLVLFHDVLYPFEYPEPWIQEGRAWNEAYLLRAFLQYNQAFSILFWGSYLTEHHGTEIARLPPDCRGGGSLWLRKTR